MATPTSFPVWLSKPGAQDMFVLDAGAFNNALAIGYSFNTLTPTTPIAAPAGVTASVVETQVSLGQLHAVFDAISHGTRR